MSDQAFTVVFNGNLRKLDGNPLKYETPFGPVLAVGIGNALADVETCPICADPLKPMDICATDITEGTCHAGCLEGSPVVDIDTGDEMQTGKIATYPYSDVMDPTPVSNVSGPITPQMIRDTAAWCQSEDELRETLSRAAEALEASPCSNVSGLHGITKEWFERRAKAEGDLEIGAGFSVVNPTDADMAQMEVLAEKALPEWAQGELSRLRLVALGMQKGYIAARDLVERAQAIISTSTYPNWYEEARAALSATATEGE